MKRFNVTLEQAVQMSRACGYQIITMKKTGETFARQVSPDGRVSVKGWRKGNNGNPAFYYLFRTEQRAAEFVKKWLAEEAVKSAVKSEYAENKKALRASLKASDYWTVGDVGYTSWGYDQTNVEYFQVVRLLPRSVVVRQVAVNSSDRGGGEGGKIAPRRYEFVGPEQKCPLNENGHFQAGPCYSGTKPSFKHGVSKWEGRAMYCSSNH